MLPLGAALAATSTAESWVKLFVAGTGFAMLGVQLRPRSRGSTYMHTRAARPASLFRAGQPSHDDNVRVCNGSFVHGSIRHASWRPHHRAGGRAFDHERSLHTECSGLAQDRGGHWRDRASPRCHPGQCRSGTARPRHATLVEQTTFSMQQMAGHLSAAADRFTLPAWLDSSSVSNVDSSYSRRRG